MCPVCRGALAGERTLRCASGHTFDLAREGYVNLLTPGRRRSRQPGDSDEMVVARRRFLATGAYDPLTATLVAAVREHGPAFVLDVGCGEGHHTRRLDAPLVAGVDVSKRAIALAARAHPSGWYAVAGAAALPVADAALDAVLVVFGPVVNEELARAVRPGGVVVAAHPGPGHLGSLRALVYADPQPHEVKPPLRATPEWFETIGSETATFPVAVADAALLADLFTMTPYRWHAPPDMAQRLSDAAGHGFATQADIVVTVYRRTGRP